ncbi:MAG: hypothetical protein M1817_004739 [Caeruleum heppii]|nr:MAG: hypothetical protein M1817_004739 [Caeruleum heppii]
MPSHRSTGSVLLLVAYLASSVCGSFLPEFDYMRPWPMMTRRAADSCGLIPMECACAGNGLECPVKDERWADTLPLPENLVAPPPVPKASSVTSQPPPAGPTKPPQPSKTATPPPNEPKAPGGGPAWGPLNPSECISSPGCGGNEMRSNFQRVFSRINLDRIYTDKTVLTSNFFKPSSAGLAEGASLLYECATPADYLPGISGASLYNA